MYELTTTEREYILKSMKQLLDEYDYDYMTTSLNDIIDEWANKKGKLIEAFKKHPNYVDGKFLIAFDYDYERGFDRGVFDRFMRYLDNVAFEHKEWIPEEIKVQCEYCGSLLPNKLYDFLIISLGKYITGKTISAETAQLLEEIIPQIHPHTGEKASRVINRICTYLGYHKHPEYNREFARFADGLSPIVIKRHTILSINPLDYLTMSFGNSWASCHTIDKQNKRGMPNSYSGQYSSGTMSYMLDGSSMVFYTVDAGYDGNDYWTQPKINRQMFHYGEDKLVQSRLYPQSNDGNSEEYTPYRNIVQAIMATIFDFPNLWTLKKGSEASSEYIWSYGTHYTDYCYFGDCSLSRLKGSTNENKFVVGAEPICINCGCRHDIQETIDHCNTGRTCDCCGCVIPCEDDEYWVGDGVYCCECVTYCDDCGCYHLNEDVRYVESVDRYVCDRCLDRHYEYCEDCGHYYYRENMTYVEGAGVYVCEDCLDDHYVQCAECEEYYELDDMHLASDGKYYCDDCYEEEEE